MTNSKELGGVINSSLWATIEEEGSTGELTMELANIFAWSINFTAYKRKILYGVLFDEIVAKNGEILSAQTYQP